MEQAITSYIVEGFMVVNKTATKATLQNKKEFEVLWAVIGFVLCILPVLIYPIVYATRGSGHYPVSVSDLSTPSRNVLF
jgi:hypothetical protein